MTTFGVLALQGDYGAHVDVLRGLGGVVREVRRCAELRGLTGLIIPGGESTTLLNLMQDEPWFEALRDFHEAGGALFGTCAGAILLSREVRCPSQPSLGFLDAVIERNAYGRQVDSFEAKLDSPALAGSLKGVFIRAPRFLAVGPAVEVLACFGEDPVLVRQGRLLAGTFHPELAGSDRVHRLFIEVANGVEVANGMEGPNRH